MMMESMGLPYEFIKFSGYIFDIKNVIADYMEKYHGDYDKRNKHRRSL